VADPIFTERLGPGRESRLDIYLFFLAFLGGLALYAVLKWLGFGQLSQTAAIISVMFAYAATVARVPRLRVRLDQAGDNAYYLGLLFTLISMAVALYEFRGSALGDAAATARSGVEAIIGNFGVALGSTIAGIFLRVLLHQMRVDPADLENMTRIELAEASKRVKAHLDQVSGNMALFQGQAGQRMNDVIATAGDAVNKVLTTFTTEVGTAMVEVLKKTEEAQKDLLTRTAGTAEKLDAMAESARASIDRLREVAPPPQRLATRLNKVCDSLDALSAPIQEITGALQQTAAEVTKAIQQIGTAAAQLDATSRESREQQTQILRHVSEAAEQFRGALGVAGETLRQDKAVLAELETHARDSSAEALRVHEAANRVLQTFTDVTRDLTALVRAASSASQVARAVEKANER
jgi:ABC-type transporter Mla subunit MlaD